MDYSYNRIGDCMKPIIGIIMRESVSSIGHKIKYTYCDIENAIIKSGGIPIGISNNDIELYLNIYKKLLIIYFIYLYNNNSNYVFYVIIPYVNQLYFSICYYFQQSFLNIYSKH